MLLSDTCLLLMPHALLKDYFHVQLSDNKQGHRFLELSYAGATLEDDWVLADMGIMPSCTIKCILKVYRYTRAEGQTGQHSSKHIHRTQSFMAMQAHYNCKGSVLRAYSCISQCIGYWSTLHQSYHYDLHCCMLVILCVTIVLYQDQYLFKIHCITIAGNAIGL